MSIEIKIEETPIKTFYDISSLDVIEFGNKRRVKDGQEIERILRNAQNGEYDIGESLKGRIQMVYFVADDFLNPTTFLEFEDFNKLGMPRRISKETKLIRIYRAVED